MTKGEELKSKSNIELAIFFMGHFECKNCPAKTADCKKPASCVDAWGKYLESEVNNEK